MDESSILQASGSTGDPAFHDTLTQPRPPAGRAGSHDTGSLQPGGASRPSRWTWTGGRITALVIGSLLVLCSIGLLVGGVVGLVVNGASRDGAGYVTTGVHGFSSNGSALVTDPIELGSPGVGWLYSAVILGEVRIRVTPEDPGADLFVGIGRTADVDRYLAGVGRTVISEFWGDRAYEVGGGTPGSPPGAQDFWVATDTGPGPRTLTWDPANGSWTVVVMNADGGPGVDVGTDLGATMPVLLAAAMVALVLGAILALGGGLLMAGAVRRAGRARSS